MTKSTPDPARAGRYYYLFRSTNPLTPNTYKPGITDDIERRWRDHGKDRWSLVYSANLGSGAAYRFEQEILSGPFSEHRLNEKGEYLGLSEQAAADLVDRIKAEELRLGNSEHEVASRERQQKIAVAQRLIAESQAMLNEAHSELRLENLHSLKDQLLDAHHRMHAGYEKAATSMGEGARQAIEKHKARNDEHVAKLMAMYKVYAAGSGDMNRVNLVEQAFTNAINAFTQNANRAMGVVMYLISESDREQEIEETKKEQAVRDRIATEEVERQVRFMKDKRLKEEQDRAQVAAMQLRKDVLTSASRWAVIFALPMVLIAGFAGTKPRDGLLIASLGAFIGAGLGFALKCDTKEVKRRENR